MAAATIVGSHALSPEPPAPDGVLLGFMRLCRQLERPVTEAELRASVTLPEAGVDLACLGKLGRPLRLRPRRPAHERAQPGSAADPVPDPRPRSRARPGWCASRTQDELVAGRPGRAEPRPPARIKVAAGFGDRIVRLMAAAPAGRGFWRSAPMRDVRAVLWQIGLASVVINLLALATPLFMMTVYNKVINHAALQTLDVLAIGMVTLVAFELAAARPARLGHRPHRRAAGGRDRQRPRPPPAAAALPLLRDEPERVGAWSASARSTSCASS